ncbi:MAG: hypothetical protein AAFV80_02030, partial [Bacteroidota bacterium]
LPKRNKIKLKGFDPEKNVKVLEDIDELEEHNNRFAEMTNGKTPHFLVGTIRNSIQALQLQIEESALKELTTEHIQEAEKIDGVIDKLQKVLYPLIDSGTDLLEKLTFEDQELADAFSERLGILNRMQILLAKLENQLEADFGIPKD